MRSALYVMNIAKEKKDEIDLIRSIFTSDELSFDDPSVVEELDLLSSKNIPIVDRDVHLTLKLPFPELTVTVVLTICLPIGYPHTHRPSIVLRVRQSANIINEKALNSGLLEWLSTAAGSGEPLLCSLVDWLRSALEEDNWDAYLGRDAFKTSPPTSAALPSATEYTLGEEPQSPSTAPKNPEICYWIFSHHIRNPKKRKVIVDWARELGLTGCCLPGKPGIVVAEGAEEKVEEYWKRIRVLTWKRIQVKDREEIAARRFTDGFFEVGGTLAEKIGYMRGHGVTQERIAAHFGFKVDGSRREEDLDDDDDDD